VGSWSSAEEDEDVVLDAKLVMPHRWLLSSTSRGVRRRKEDGGEKRKKHRFKTDIESKKITC
jgi:hypothetical protein